MRQVKNIDKRLKSVQERLDVQHARIEERPDVLSQIETLAFEAQRTAMHDTSQLICCFCTRRSGKSGGCSIMAIDSAIRYPGSTVLIAGLTRASVKNTFWRAFLKRFNSELSIGCSFNESELTMEFPNGSVINLVGLAANEQESAKVLGQAFSLVVIDEAQDFGTDLSELVYSTLRPACADLRGRIVLAGTPGPFASGLFYDVTTGKEKGWSVHSWSAYDNPHMVVQWKEEIDLECRSGRDKTARFKREYLGEWVSSDDERVYRCFSPARNLCNGVPVMCTKTTILGIDLGYSDDSAFVVCRYSPIDPVLYVLHSEKHPKMDITNVAAVAKELIARYGVDTSVIDGANKQAVMEMVNRHQLNLLPTQKHGKVEFIEMFNDDLLMGKIKLLDGNSELTDEWSKLVWKIDRANSKDHLKRIEHPGCPNHLSDAMLYAWRFSFAFLSRKPRELPKRGSPEWFKSEEDDIWKRLEDAKREELEEDVKNSLFMKDDIKF